MQNNNSSSKGFSKEGWLLFKLCKGGDLKKEFRKPCSSSLDKKRYQIFLDKTLSVSLLHDSITERILKVFLI